MKRPKKKGTDRLNFGRNLSFSAGVENGRVYGWNEALVEADRYYKRIIREKYIKKAHLPSEKDIEEIVNRWEGSMIKKGYQIRDIDDLQELIQGLAKRIKGRKNA